MFFLNLAIGLDRTLVLPRGRLLQRMSRGQFAAEAEYVRWGELFNLSAINELHHAIELETFLAQGGKIDHLRYADGVRFLLLAPRTFPLLLTSSTLLAQWKAPGGAACQESTAPHVVTFNGIRGVHVDQSLCDASLRYSKEKLKKLPFTAIAFDGSTDQHSAAQVAPLRPYVRFEQHVYDEAAAFVERTFSGEPFVALHWRRTDFLIARQTQSGVLQSAEALVKHAKELMLRHSVKHVYLATDSDDQTELAYVREALAPARYTRAETGGLRARAEVANVEITICGMAAHFLGTKSSSYSLAIAEERHAVFGQPANTAAHMDLLAGSPPPPPAGQPMPASGGVRSPPARIAGRPVCLSRGMHAGDIASYLLHLSHALHFLHV